MRTTRACAVAAFVVTAVLIGVPSTQASRPLLAHVAAFASDSNRYVAWQVHANDPLAVLDTRAGTRRSISLPPECRLWPWGSMFSAVPNAAGGRFLLTCGRSGAAAVLDLQTSATTLLPNPYGQGGYEWLGFGTRYLEGQGVPGCRFCVTLYDISTRVVTTRPESYVPDLDAAGALPVCPRLRKRVGKERPFTKWQVYSHGVLVRNTGPTERPEDVVIDRCRGRRSVLRCRCRPLHFALGGHWVTWDTGGREPSQAELPPEGPGRLYAYDLAHHRRSTWRLPEVALSEVGPTPSTAKPTLIETGAFGYSAHTSTRVFWVAARIFQSPNPLAGAVEDAAVYPRACRSSAPVLLRQPGGPCVPPRRAADDGACRLD
jgi:hypothetical protein